MLVNKSIERHFYTLAGIPSTEMSSAEPDNQTNLRKIQYSFSMAICPPPNIFAMYSPLVQMERTADYK